MEYTKYNIDYVKLKPIDWKTLEEQYNPSEDEDIIYKYNPFSIQSIQNYHPMYSKFFVLTKNNYNKIGLNHPYHFHDMNTVYDINNDTFVKKDIFIKYSPLLDPYRFMTGKYVKYDYSQLPNLDHNLTEPSNKFTDYNNASYVDNFFCFIASNMLRPYNFVHSVEYYGSFLAFQNLFKVNVIDDYEFLQSSDYFLANLNNLFYVEKSNKIHFTGSRANKLKLNISKTRPHNITVVSLDADMEVKDDTMETLGDAVYEKTLSSESSDSSSSSSEDESEDEDVTKNKEISSEEEYSEDSDWETEEDSNNGEEEEEETQYAFIKNFPVQMICLEKCDGTLDELFMKKIIDEDIAASALVQVIMTLITYQHIFHFTHNDLHTNNIMFSKTEKEFLYYEYKNHFYKVPTYGRIFKIIDFGRSIYRVNGQLFCSDSFAVGGDANRQYNTEPYLNKNKPRLDPNYSFDLCRLGSSIYDFIINDVPKNMDGYNELQKTVYRWCTDDKGKNVLYKPNGEERYPGFKLYKMIAKTVHRHVPEDELKYPFFQQFIYKGSMDGVDPGDIMKIL